MFPVNLTSSSKVEVGQSGAFCFPFCVFGLFQNVWWISTFLVCAISIKVVLGLRIEKHFISVWYLAKDSHLLHHSLLFLFLVHESDKTPPFEGLKGFYFL